MGFLANKKALVLRPSKKSIAYGIAKALKEQGASVAITFKTKDSRKELKILVPNCPLRLL